MVRDRRTEADLEALAGMLLKPLVWVDESNVVSEPDNDAPGTTNDGVDMKFADRPFANDIPCSTPTTVHDLTVSAL